MLLSGLINPVEHFESILVQDYSVDTRINDHPFHQTAVHSQGSDMS